MEAEGAVSEPVVSILIPAYNERFFADAFGSALGQTLADVEIVVSDDSPGDAIGRVVAEHADPRVRYVRNTPALGFAGNFTRSFELARGRYVKFLNDDDRLHPRCVEALAGVLDANPTVSLAATRRVVIDEAGKAQPDVASTTPISYVSAFMPGVELGDFCLVNGMNFIGEPSTVLFRRGDVQPGGGSIFRWADREYHCLADLSLWLRLLSRGLAYYGAAALSEYRRHPGQEQRRPEVRMTCLVEYASLLAPAQAAGFLRTPQLRAAAVHTMRSMASVFEPFAEGHPELSEALAGMRSKLDAFAAS